MTPEQAAQGEFLQALNNQVVRSAELAAELAGAQQRIESLLKQVEQQAGEIEELKKDDNKQEQQP